MDNWFNCHIFWRYRGARHQRSVFNPFSTNDSRHDRRDLGKRKKVGVPERKCLGEAGGFELWT